MKVNRSNVWSTVISENKKEIEDLEFLLTDKDGNEKLIFENGSGEIKFHTGLIDFIKKCGIKIEIEKDENPSNYEIVNKESINLSGFTLRDYQISGIRKAIYWERGMLQAPTGSGKSIFIAAITKYLLDNNRINRGLILVPTGFLMQQTISLLSAVGINCCGVGFGNPYDGTSKIVVSVVNSAYREVNTKCVPWISEADLLILDEGHKASSKLWSDVCEQCNARYRYLFTATILNTPGKVSFSDLRLMGHTGHIIFNLKSKEVRDKGHMATPYVLMIKTKSGSIPPKFTSFNFVYNVGIAKNRIRNSLICSIAADCYAASYKSMVFVGRKEHGKLLAKKITDEYGYESIVVTGGKNVSIYSSHSVINRLWSMEEISLYMSDRDRAIIIATTVLDEGVDIPSTNVLIMAAAMKKYRRFVQRAGRGMRPKEGDNSVYLFDFYDTSHFYLKHHSDDRIKIYETEEYNFFESTDEACGMMGVNLELRRDLFPKGGRK